MMIAVYLLDLLVPFLVTIAYKWELILKGSVGTDRVGDWSERVEAAMRGESDGYSLQVLSTLFYR